MTSAEDVEKVIRDHEFYGRLIIPMCFPAYFLGGEKGLHAQYMEGKFPDMDEGNYANMLAQCKQVMEVYAIILGRDSS